MLTTVLIIDKRKELSTKYKKSLDSQKINAVEVIGIIIQFPTVVRNTAR